MTETTRRNVLRYGIAIDLVILATGVGMLLPATPLTLILLFTAAVALSTWKGGWPGALTALILGAASLAGVFAFHANPLLAYLAASLAVAAGMLALMRPRPVKE